MEVDGKAIRNYWFIFFLIFFGLIVMMKTRSAGFSPAELDRAILTQGRFAPLTSDLCENQIGGDPVDPDQSRVTVKFICGKKYSINSVSFAAMEPKTVAGALAQVFRMNRIDTSVLDRITCHLEDKQPASMDQGVSIGTLIECARI